MAVRPSRVELESLLGPVREAVRAVGVDAQVVEWDEGSLSMRLVLDAVGCQEGVLPRASLEQTMLAMLRPGFSTLREARLTDPREPDAEQA